MRASKAKPGFPTVLVIIGSLAGAELLAEPMWDWQYRVITSRILKGFQYVDPSDNVTRNKPGSWTYRQLHHELTSQGRHLGVDDLEHLAAQYNLQPDDVVVSINRHGFVGPEILDPRPPRTVRVMTIGDSVTFGPYYYPMSYPRVMERAIASAGFQVEVINSAVQGYSLDKVLKRLDEFMELEPDVITVMIGWNRTLIRADPGKNESLYRGVALYRFFYHLWSRSTEATQFPGHAANFYNPADPFMARLRQTTFEFDLKDWGELTDRIHARLPRCRIVVLGLGGLFMDGIQPDAAAIKLGYSVTFTHNLDAWAVLTAAYNQKLAQFAREQKLGFIDVGEWSRGAFQPRSSYFIDSVHPNSRGYELMGKHIASEMIRQAFVGRT